MLEPFWDPKIYLSQQSQPPPPPKKKEIKQNKTKQNKQKNKKPNLPMSGQIKQHYSLINALTQMPFALFCRQEIYY